MKYFLFLFYFIVIFINSKELNNAEEKLLFVYQQFRHGARQPYRSFDDKNWKDLLKENWKGYGELTPLGMRMHYLLGINTKLKYEEFLNGYNPNNIRIRSTDVNRTILSGLSTLQGLFNNSGNYILNENQIKKGIILNKNYSEKISDKIKSLGKNSVEGGFGFYPNYIFPTNYNHQYNIFRRTDCPGIEKYINEIKNSDEIKKLTFEISEKINNSYGEYIFKFFNKSGVEEPLYLYDYDKLFDIADTFITDYFNGRELKDFNNTGINMEDFYNECLNISFIESCYRTFGISPTKLLYLSISPIFHSLFNYIDKRIEIDKNPKSEINLSDSPKFILTSGHDNSLGLNDLFLKHEFNLNFERPLYSQSQVYELWKNESDNKYYIKYLVNQKLKATFVYEEFKSKVESKLYSQEKINEICNSTEK